MKKVVFGGFLLLCGTFLWIISSIGNIPNDNYSIMSAIGTMFMIIGFTFGIIGIFTNDK